MRRFVADYAKAMTAFAGEFVHQTSRLFMLQLSSFAAALAQDRPFFHSKVACHIRVCLIETGPC